MSTDYSIITNSAIKNNRIMAGLLSDGRQVREIPIMIGPGIESAPLPKFERVVSVDVHNSSSMPAGIGGQTDITPIVLPGERRIIAVGLVNPSDESAGIEVKSSVYFKKDGMQIYTKSGATITISNAGDLTIINSGATTISTAGKITADGTAIELNGATKSLVTHAELSTALSGFISALNLALGTKLDGGGTPGTLTLDISGAATTTVKTGG